MGLYACAAATDEMGNCFQRFICGHLSCTNSQDGQEKELIEEDGDNNGDGLVYQIVKHKRKKHSKFIDRFWEKKDLNYSRLKRNLNDPSNSEIQLQCLDAQSLMVTNAASRAEKHQTFGPDACSGIASSPGGSSLDLEWEHEYGPHQSWIALPEETAINELSSEDDNPNASQLRMRRLARRRHHSKRSLNGGTTPANYSHTTSMTAASSVTSCSYVSSESGSLEWDVDNEQLQSDTNSIDQETKDLLQEIEQLKIRVLNETGAVFNNSNDFIEHDS